METIINSPIYAMSLGSHELFHSNLWAWLMQCYPETINKVFGFDSELGNCTIEREAQNIDITISHKGKKYIIENKFKSVPYQSQLDEYKNKLGKKFEQGKLACIIEPSFKLNGWDILTYDTILSNLKKFIKDHELKNNDKCILKEYIQVTETVVEKIKEVLKEEVLAISAKDFSEYEKYRISDILRKLNASKFEAYLNNELKNKFSNLYICSDYSHKKGIISAFFMETTAESEGKTDREIILKSLYNFAIGVQLEGNEFRVVVCRAGHNKQTHEKIFDDYSQDWFDENFKKGNLISLLGKEYKTSMSPRDNRCYNKYDSTKYCFVYQYFDYSDKSFGSVCALMKSFLDKAQNLFYKHCGKSR